MSRWICIDNICIPSDENDWDELVAFADVVAEQEPIDLVRCAECKHNVGLRDGREFWEEDITCDYWESDGLTADDFCSYGERREDDE